MSVKGEVLRFMVTMIPQECENKVSIKSIELIVFFKDTLESLKIETAHISLSYQIKVNCRRSLYGRNKEVLAAYASGCCLSTKLCAFSLRIINE